MSYIKQRFMDDNGDMMAEDFYDQMTPIWLAKTSKEALQKKSWSKVMAEEYNKDTEEDERMKEVKWDDRFNGTSGKDLDQVIDPKHYKDVAYGYQYIQLMIPMLKRFSGVEAHLMGQTYKYLMRAGNKDPLLQDLKKAKWYLEAMIEHLSTNNITVKD